MARRNGKTPHTVAEIQAGTIITAQNMDEINVTDLGEFGRDFTFLSSDTTTADDGEYTLEESGEAGRWRSESVNSLIAAGIAVAHGLVPDNTDSDSINVTIAGVDLGKTYLISPATANALPAGVTIRVEQDNASGSLDFIIFNNSGVNLPAGSIDVNIYEG